MKITNYDEWPRMAPERKLNIKAFHSAFEKRIPKDKNIFFSGESHNFWEMVYITEGSLGVSADDRIYELKADQVIFHKPMEFHKLWKNYEGKTSCFICSFDLEGDYGFLEENVFSVEHSQRRIIDLILARMRKYPRESYEAALNDNPTEWQHLANLLELFFILLSEGAQKVETIDDSGDTVLYNRVVNILKDNLSATLCVDKVAAMCNVSTSKLNKLFAVYAGCGVHAYHIKLRVNEAVRLIENGYSSKEVSDMLGFNNQNYFSTTFKRETGLSPMNYRKKM